MVPLLEELLADAAMVRRFDQLQRARKRGWIATLTARQRRGCSLPEPDADADRDVGREIKLVGDHDFLVLVDLGEALDGPGYWIVPTGVAAGLLRNEQIRTSDVEEFEGGWELLDEGSSQTAPLQL